MTDDEIFDRVRRIGSDPRTVMSTIRWKTRPGILRSRRRARWRARLARAWELRRFVVVPVLFAGIVYSFWRAWGVAGVAASMLGLGLALLIFGLIAAWGES